MITKIALTESALIPDGPCRISWVWLSFPVGNYIPDLVEQDHYIDGAGRKKVYLNLQALKKNDGSNWIGRLW